MGEEMVTDTTPWACVLPGTSTGRSLYLSAAAEALSSVCLEATHIFRPKPYQELAFSPKLRPDFGVV